MCIPCIVEIPEARIELRKDCVLHVDLKPELILTLEQLKKVVAAREE